MQHTIELSDIGEESLRRIAVQIGQSEETALRALAEATLVANPTASRDERFDFVLTIGDRNVYVGLSDDEPPIRSTPNVLGGDACIRNIRIPVWILVGYKNADFTDEKILAEYPNLTRADLAAAWSYYAANAERVNAERRRHEEAD